MNLLIYLCLINFSKIEFLKSNSQKIKTEIFNLCKKVEETLIKNGSDSNSNEKNNFQDEEARLKTEEFFPIHLSINKYKDLITDTKLKMERFYNLRKIENYENEIKLKTENLQNLKTENSSLNFIKKNQKKGIADFEDKNYNKYETKMVFDKLQNLKEEFRFSKDLQKSSEANIKKLNAKIVSLEEKNRKIREVIDLKKKLENHREKNQNVNEYPEGNFNKIEEKIKFTEIQISSDERNYKNEINKQNIIIAKLNDEMAILNLEIKDREQQIKLYEITLKETQKIRNLSNIRKIPNDFSLVKNSKNEV